MAKYIITADDTLWMLFKSKCAREGKTMLEVIISLIEKYVNQK